MGTLSNFWRETHKQIDGLWYVSSVGILVPALIILDSCEMWLLDSSIYIHASFMATSKGSVNLFAIFTRADLVRFKANILVTSKMRACLADFGLSSVVHDSLVHFPRSSGPRGGTLRWLAPELLQGSVEYEHKSWANDMYAFGCVCYEVFCFVTVSIIGSQFSLGVRRASTLFLPQRLPCYQ